MTGFLASPRTFGLLLLAVAALAGCVSIEQAAPPVAMLGLTASSSKLSTLEQGRLIYITRCAKCHSVEPVARYSRAKWEEILPEMTEETKLNAAEGEAVRAYVLTVLNQQAAHSVQGRKE